MIETIAAVSTAKRPFRSVAIAACLLGLGSCDAVVLLPSVEGDALLAFDVAIERDRVKDFLDGLRKYCNAQDLKLAITHLGPPESNSNRFAVSRKGAQAVGFLSMGLPSYRVSIFREQGSRLNNQEIAAWGREVTAALAPLAGSSPVLIFDRVNDQ